MDGVICSTGAPSRVEFGGFSVEGVLPLTAILAVLLDEFGDERRPAGLVAGAESGAVVAVKILIERNVIAPQRAALKELVRAEDGPAPVGVAREDSHEAV